ncbi:hypothetical protein L1987_72702 [Smallanthus sonchifolius]|uniref:Uncharacterized protein n=1 Tax=Smallanthus sonchifolius TaxID=185202 RepID=A0ACB9AV50_9ASTR|nr:hypothetical protein L1987_72702 [Smallanthus sonchifolius]
MTRAQRKTRIKIENNVLLRMTAMMVDGQVSKVDSIKVQCEDDLYGYESYTYLTWDDFQAVFTLEELTGAVITSYTIHLFEQIKNGSKKEHGICFVSSTASSPRERKTKSKNIDDSSRSIAERLAIVLIQITISIKAHLPTNMLSINNTWAGREAATAIVLPGLVERLQQPLFCGDLLDLEYLTLFSTERTLECLNSWLESLLLNNSFGLWDYYISGWASVLP